MTASGEVCLTVRCHPEAAAAPATGAAAAARRQFRFEVSDMGPPVKEAEVHKSFHHFWHLAAAPSAGAVGRQEEEDALVGDRSGLGLELNLAFHMVQVLFAPACVSP